MSEKLLNEISSLEETNRHLNRVNKSLSLQLYATLVVLKPIYDGLREAKEFEKADILREYLKEVNIDITQAK
jgi:cysteinyl-tRNA synthetase